MRILAICIINFVSISPLECVTKSFKNDASIYSSRNWVDGKPQKTCNGLIFPEITESVVQLGKLNVENIVLPSIYAFFHLAEDFEIVFDENTDSQMNCVELKDLNTHGWWSSPSSWETTNQEDNVAIPHMERVPCEHDDVVFPHGIETGTIVHFGSAEIKMRSLQFGDEKWTNEDLIYYWHSPTITEIFVTYALPNTFDITSESCKDPSGCICGNKLAYSVGECRDVPPVTNLNCLSPVTPIGFCTNICGASILAEPNDSFKIAEMEDILRTFSSDTYVSKVKNSTGQELIQIIFAEKEFTGESLDEARSFHQRISSDPNLNLERVELYSSGEYYREGSAGKNAVGVIFGTLFLVGLIFVAIFSIYFPEGSSANLRNRLNIGSRPISDLTSRFFARYDSVGEDAGLIFEGRSMSGSVVSLAKAFENPMYGREKEESTPSTSSNSEGPNISLEKGSRSEIDSENNLFVIEESNEVVENVPDEEGELVDLTS